MDIMKEYKTVVLFSELMSINQISGIIGLLGDVSSPIKDYSFQAVWCGQYMWDRNFGTNSNMAESCFEIWNFLFCRFRRTRPLGKIKIRILTTGGLSFLVLDLEVWTRRRMHLKFGLKKIEYIRSIRWRTIVDSICDGINFGQHYIR
ncbi:unnamed protein product [Rhizophagus irregularis]|uniref:Uncharacterized protein n=1 Tax=Rhizophagus irregularis TaxID=588596 RepID=A0A915ZM87_9GLOM|nr:unnamed protein product [Rhizophagus irregularis]